jgi:hypothetical protein
VTGAALLNVLEFGLIPKRHRVVLAAPHQASMSCPSPSARSTTVFLVLSGVPPSFFSSTMERPAACARGAVGAGCEASRVLRLHADVAGARTAWCGYTQDAAHGVVNPRHRHAPLGDEHLP